jgi:SAM-dependent methyltransferase
MTFATWLIGVGALDPACCPKGGSLADWQAAMMFLMTDERQRLRATFDSAASLYQQARPGYPSELYDELVYLAALQARDRLLEIGCASGKATVPLARRGFPITCIELGSALAAEARRNLAQFPDVQVINAPFESWQPPRGQTFALVFAATAWQWLDPALRYQKAWALLRRGGHLAFWDATHVFPAESDPFFREIQEVYDEIGEGLPVGAGWPRPGGLPDSRAQIEASGLFDDVVVRQFDWETTYTAEEYIRLLDTFSGHIAMPEWKRSRLYGEIRRRLGERPDGRLRRHWGAVLHVARRGSASPSGSSR